MNGAQAAPVAALVLTYNEEANVEACLRSVSGWCRQLFVVDSGSADRTREICARYTNLVFVHPYTTHGAQWEWALHNLPVECEWVLALDADHVVSGELRDQIIAAGQNPRPDVAAYYARHHMYFRGQRIRGFKGKTLCLFRRDRVRVDRAALSDHRLAVDGASGLLSGVLEERNRKEWDIDFWIDKHQQHASQTAAEEILLAAGRMRSPVAPRFFGNPTERIFWLKQRWNGLPLYLRPALYFFYRYILRLGFLDGATGLLYHFLQAFWFRLIVDVKVSDYRRQLAAGALTLEQLAAENTRNAAGALPAAE